MSDMKQMFDSLDPEHIHRHTSAVIESIIDTIREHQVRPWLSAVCGGVCGGGLGGAVGPRAPDALRQPGGALQRLECGGRVAARSGARRTALGTRASCACTGAVPARAREGDGALLWRRVQRAARRFAHSCVRCVVAAACCRCAARRACVQVTLRSAVSTVVVTTLVLEGWSTKLNPEMRILDHVRDMLMVDWNERISLTVDKIMRNGSLAVV